MRKVVVTRTETGPEGTFGTILTDSGLSLYSLELPWADNTANISCIPAGVYKCEYGLSPRHGPTYYVRDVPGRTDVEIHAANWARQLLGCLAPGRAIGEIAGVKAVMSSRDALLSLEDDLERLEFELTIKWGQGIGPTGS